MAISKSGISKQLVPGITKIIAKERYSIGILDPRAVYGSSAEEPEQEVIETKIEEKGEGWTISQH